MVAGINGASNSPKNKKKTRDYDQKTGNLAWMPKPPKEKPVDAGDGSVKARQPGESLSDYKRRRYKALQDAMDQM
tara:strand:+ start:173 stop:397 length:225 start_codon:yes stop_codon:yes gene_type:complete